jgi:hypothetical protein
MLHRSRTHLHTLALGQTNPWFVLSNDKHIAFSSGERILNRIFDVDDVEAAIMTFTMRDDAHTTHVTPTCDHGDGSSVELDEIGNLARSQIDLDSVIDFDERIWVSNPKLTCLSSVSHPNCSLLLVFPTKHWSNV